jgi:hypothetical protein
MNARRILTSSFLCLLTAGANGFSIYDSSSTPNPVQLAPVTLTGTVTITTFPPPISCEFSVDAVVEQDINGVEGTITITDARLSTPGSVLCTAITPTSLPWVSNPIYDAALPNVAGPGVPTNVDFNNAHINICGTATPFTTVFNNNSSSPNAAPSSLNVTTTFGSCAMNGLLVTTGPADVDIFK